MTGEISLFWDNSNIWLVGRGVCARREPGDEGGFRIHFANLLNYARNGRVINYAFVGGSIPPESDPLWGRFEDLHIRVEKQERGVSGGEIAVDEAIQLAMANRLLDMPQPETFVLLTGDGAGYSQGKGFIAALERAVRKGCNIEVVSWDAGINRYLKSFAETHGRYISLEPVYDRVTFINNKRWAS
jgi:hypothetical protein